MRLFGVGSFLRFISLLPIEVKNIKALRKIKANFLMVKIDSNILSFYHKIKTIYHDKTGNYPIIL